MAEHYQGEALNVVLYRFEESLGRHPVSRGGVGGGDDYLVRLAGLLRPLVQRLRMRMAWLNEDVILDSHGQAT
jgi:hypothetical protein